MEGKREKFGISMGKGAINRGKGRKRGIRFGKGEK